MLHNVVPLPRAKTDGAIQEHKAEFASYLKIIGRGKNAGKTLSEQQAYEAMSLLLCGSVAPEQRGAFLMLLRVREETEAELAGFLRACRDANQWQFCWQDSGGQDSGWQDSGWKDSESRPHLDIGCYAGKRRHLPWMLLALLVLAGQGYRVFLHGSCEPDSQRLYMDEVWRYFGWETANNAAQAEAQLNQYGICYAPLQRINPALHELIQLRALLGLRSCASSLARMLNPAQAKHSVHGVFHRKFDERHVQVAGRLNDESVFCFRGDGGEAEVNPERDCALWFRRNGVVEHKVLPALLDKCQVKPSALSPELLVQVWQGKANTYGDAAVVGSLAVFLSVLHHGAPVDMLGRAKEIWQNRDRNWPSR